MIWNSFIVAFLVYIARAEPTPRSTVVLESLASVPNGFVDNGVPDPNTNIQLRIALRQANMTGLEQELYAVSNPDSDRYGQHLSKEEVSVIYPTSHSVAHSCRRLKHTRALPPKPSA